MEYSLSQKFHHFLIISRWKRFVVPVFCSAPYVLSLLWLVSRNQFWIAQIMLAPLVMMVLVIALGLFLAKIEFRR